MDLESVQNGAVQLRVGRLFWLDGPQAPSGVYFAVLRKLDRVASVHAFDIELRQIGHLKWPIAADEHGEVTWIEVVPEWRRKRVATVMWEIASTVVEPGWPAPHHSKDRTLEGDAWARSVGGELPALKLIESSQVKGTISNPE